ncbi:MAG TPA: DedA family protein [Methylomirabilota bacterium]|jgi:membrane protein DedA with SNARE-associated domain
MLTLDAIVDQLAGHNAYLGVFALLLAGSLGVPIPEELPVIAAGVLSREGLAVWWLALPVCVLGVVSGDVILYWAGYHWGEQVLSWRPVRWVLTRERERRLKAAYCRHAVKTIVIARHVVGLRAAAFLTAGISRVPFWKFLATDAVAALAGLPLSFGLAYFFTDQIEAVVTDVHRVERWTMLGVLVVGIVAAALAVRRWTQRAEARIDARLDRPEEDPEPLEYSTRRD